MIDGALLIKTLLSANWDSANTNSRTPSFKEYYEQKKANSYDNKDEAYVYDRVTTNERPYQGNIALRVVYRATIDLRTDYSKNHCLLMQNEAKRILKANHDYVIPVSVAYGTAGQQVIIESRDITHYSNSIESKYHKNFKKIVDVEIIAPVEVTP